MKPLIISAPFGNYLSFPGATSTLGTFTLHHRGGLAYRLWRCLLTLRYRIGVGWVNRLGLPNPGIRSLSRETGVGSADRRAVDYSDFIISIKGFNRGEWDALASHLIGDYGSVRYIELNLSCPNVGEAADHSCRDAIPAAERLVRAGKVVIAKLPPLRWQKLVYLMWSAGVNHWHCCNTIPAPGGGISGKVLKQYSLWAIEDIRERYSGTIIGGGGITSQADIEDYRRAGADHFAVGSVLLNPLNWRKVRRWVL